MSKKFTIAGVILFIASFFAHPDKCLSVSSVLANLPDHIQTYAPHAISILSAVLLAFGKSLTDKKKNEPVTASGSTDDLFSIPARDTEQE